MKNYWPARHLGDELIPQQGGISWATHRQLNYSAKIYAMQEEQNFVINISFILNIYFSLQNAIAASHSTRTFRLHLAQKK